MRAKGVEGFPALEPMPGVTELNQMIFVGCVGISGERAVPEIESARQGMPAGAIRNLIEIP